MEKIDHNMSKEKKQKLKEYQKKKNIVKLIKTESLNLIKNA